MSTDNQKLASFKPFNAEINKPSNIINYFENLKNETGINLLDEQNNIFLDNYLNKDITEPTKLTTTPQKDKKSIYDWLKESKEKLPKVTWDVNTQKPMKNTNISKNSEGSATKAINYLMNNEGLSKEIATAIAANLKHESNFRTHVIGDKNLGRGNEAFGIAQWRLDRKDDLYEFLKNKELPYTSFEGQLSFIVHELKHGKEKNAWSKMQSTNDVGKLAEIFDRNYERSDGKSVNKRIKTAYELYNL